MPTSEAAYWSQDASALAAGLGSGAAGLTSDAAASQLAAVGHNSVEETPRLSALRLLLRQFESPLVLILAFAAAISLVLQQWVDAGIILAIVLGSSLLGFLQEYRASTAVEELKKRLALTARVLRDGLEQVVPVTQIVPGDVILLVGGQPDPRRRPRDRGAGFPGQRGQHDRQVLSRREAAGSHRRRDDARRADQYRLSRILGAQRHGEGPGCRTGRRTEFGAIAARLRSRPPETDFARGVRQFGYLLIRVMVVIVLFVLTVNLLLDRPVIESLLFAVALAVGLSPELLPAIISVTLSAGARAMSRRGVIVRRLDAIENLGSMSVLCTDKTGTLTEGTVVLSEVLDTTNRPSDEVRRLGLCQRRAGNRDRKPAGRGHRRGRRKAPELTTVGLTQDRRDPL